mgnify:CR=1 FL=1
MAIRKKRPLRRHSGSVLGLVELGPVEARRLERAAVRAGEAFWSDPGASGETEVPTLFDVQVRRSRWRFRKPGTDAAAWLTFDVAYYDGRMEVTDPGRLLQIIEQGLGRGKAFGLGLLSVAP